MTLFTIAKYCSGVLVAGTSIAVPAVAVTQKWSWTGSQSRQQSQVISRDSGKEVVSQEQISRERTFDDCMKQYLKEFQVQNNLTKEIKTISIRELSSYLKQKEQWTVLDTYKGQCQMQQ